VRKSETKKCGVGKLAPGATKGALLGTALMTIALFVAGCGPPERPTESVTSETGAASYPSGLLVALAALDEDDDGNVVPLPAELGILTYQDGSWRYREMTDVDSNVFHKAMAYSSPWREGVLTLGGTGAFVKLWPAAGDPEILWEADFGGKFSRMRDAEVADLFGDGAMSIAVATHDQGVVAVLHPAENGDIEVIELDREVDTFVHEIETGDLDSDGVLEVYATPSEPNKLDGTPQPGKVVRYIPALEEGRTVVADLGDRHAKEILVEDVDGDGKDELYVSVEAVSGGKVEIRRYDADTDPTGGEVIAELDDRLCRFLAAGDIDGDGTKDMVAAANKSGVWLLRPGSDGWSKELVDPDSSGFEHAAVFADLDDDGVDELYVASDKHDEIRRYVWQDGTPERHVIYHHSDGLSRFTWNLMPVPVELVGGEI
jgi:hypothetical protein